MQQSELFVETPGTILTELCVDAVGRDVWIPHSQIHSDSEVFDADANSVGQLVVTRWFAEKERLV